MADTEDSIQESGIPQLSFTVSPSTNVQTPVDDTLTTPEMAADAKATGDAIQAVADDLTNLASDVAGIEQWTGADIPLNEEESAPTIAKAVKDLQDGIMGDIYPVGSIYMSIESTAPTFGGTWVEVLVTATWAQLKTGTRGYSEGTGTGAVHFWLRTA